MKLRHYHQYYANLHLSINQIELCKLPKAQNGIWHFSVGNSAILSKFSVKQSFIIHSTIGLMKVRKIKVFKTKCSFQHKEKAHELDFSYWINGQRHWS